MLTIHVADLLLPGGGREPVAGGAVAVQGREIVAVGPYEELVAAYPGARVRRWPGVLAPGLFQPDGPGLLERTYHPDPREAAELGSAPITGDALAALAMTDTRWGASARRGVQRMLAHGTVAVAGPFTRPTVRTAVARSGLRVGEAGRAGLVAGGPADFAVFDVPVDEMDEVPERALRLDGAGGCVATVLGGRLVYRRA
ncbi:imidazolonepropionase-like domain-containing protein [Streptomyces sp. NPDC020681]|uniref:imidazolonepropionase-like domain-containing protein n=1 Tax=Streptomyces sp. NPDC020681 TaxID=3365083 RepID=UPI00379C91C1